jgi:hypothetical protein
LSFQADIDAMSDLSAIRYVNICPIYVRKSGDNIVFISMIINALASGNSNSVVLNASSIVSSDDEYSVDIKSNTSANDAINGQFIGL